VPSLADGGGGEEQTVSVGLCVVCVSVGPVVWRQGEKGCAEQLNHTGEWQEQPSRLPSPLPPLVHVIWGGGATVCCVCVGEGAESCEASSSTEGFGCSRPCLLLLTPSAEKDASGGRRVWCVCLWGLMRGGRGWRGVLVWFQLCGTPERQEQPSTLPPPPRHYCMSLGLGRQSLLCVFPSGVRVSNQATFYRCNIASRVTDKAFASWYIVCVAWVVQQVVQDQAFKKSLEAAPKLLAKLPLHPLKRAWQELGAGKGLWHVCHCTWSAVSVTAQRSSGN